MKKTVEDFKKAVNERGITQWDIRTCSLCHHPISYRFIDGNVFFDSNCDCVTYTSELQPRTWESLCYSYNCQTTPSVIEKMDKFWGF